MKSIPPVPFKRFFDYGEVSALVAGLARARPGLAEAGSLGRSPEGREIHLLTITDFSTGAPGDKPAYLVHGNIHATELSGTHAALETARRLLADAPGSDLLRRVAFYIVPRLNPDGAEFVIKTSGAIRSRLERSRREANTLYQADLNADGLILSMRRAHPDGSFVADPEEPRLLVRRRREHAPPYYQVLPEGLIHRWDGSENFRVEGRGYDWNRNWSYDWRPEPEQGGAGDFPFSEPEMRALADFIFARDNIFGILGYHTGPAALLRPPSTGSDSDLDAADLRVMEELAAFGAEKTGLPVCPVVKYHGADARDINLRGHFHNFGYHHLGLFVFEFELGILLNSAGMTTAEMHARPSAADHEARQRRLLEWWDRQKERDRIYAPWRPFTHPQLGPVEIGGLLPRHTAGRTLPDLARICEGTYRFTLEHAARHPRVVLEDARVEAVGGGILRIRLRVANRGQFPTQVSNKGLALRRLKTVRVEFHPAPGASLLSRAGHHDLGHLAGLTGSRQLEWFVAAPGRKKALCEITVAGGAGGNTRLSLKKPAGA